MGSRKRKSAELKKELNKNRYIARIRNCSVSPRKMRPVTRIIKGKDAALDQLIQESLPEISVYEMLVIKKSEIELKQKQ